MKESIRKFGMHTHEDDGQRDHNIQKCFICHRTGDKKELFKMSRMTWKMQDGTIINNVIFRCPECLANQKFMEEGAENITDEDFLRTAKDEIETKK